MLGLAGIAAGQELPKLDVFGGYSYLRLHSGSITTDSSVNFLRRVSSRNVNLSLAGWNVSATQNFNWWLGGEFDAREAYETTTITINIPPNIQLHRVYPAQIRAFSYGPRFSLRSRLPHMTAYAHVLAGAAFFHLADNRAGSSSASATALTVIPGAGIDLNVTQWLSIQLLQVDYMMTQFYNQRQDNGTVSTGFVIHFGNK